MKIKNKSAPLSVTVRETYEAGIVLLGSEVKAVKLGHADLAGSYVKIMGSEAYLINAKVFPYKFARIENYDEGRTRKLLLHKKELLALKSKLSQGNLTLVPLALYEKHNIIKIELALAAGKKQHEKRAEIRKREKTREAEEALKRHR